MLRLRVLSVGAVLIAIQMIDITYTKHVHVHVRTHEERAT